MKRLAVILIIVATLAALGRVCAFGFTNVEDEGLITQNPNLNPPTARGLLNHWTQPHIGLYIPVTYTAWWLLARVGTTQVPDESGALLNPWLFHASNLALHVTSALLVYSILRRLRLRDTAALIGALLFALHPIQVEAVAWTTGMKDVLCGALALAAIDLHLAADESRHRRALALTALLLFVLSMLAKPAAVVLPVMLLIVDRALLQKSRRDALLAAAPWFALALPMLLITRLVQPAADVVSAPLWARPLIAADALAFYLAKLLWPFDLTMAYGRSPQYVLQTGQIAWTWLAPAVVAIVALLVRRRRLTVGLLLFVVGLLPVLGLTKFTFQQFSTVADRYVYLSMLGAALIAADLAEWRWNRSFAVGWAVLLLALAARSFDQAGTWSDRLTLYRHATLAAPDSPVAHANLAAVLINHGQFADAAVPARRAIALAPQNAGYRRNLALLLEAQQRWPELVEQLEAIMKLSPKDETARWLQTARDQLVNPATTPSAPPPASQPF